MTTTQTKSGKYAVVTLHDNLSRGIVQSVHATATDASRAACDMKPWGLQIRDGHYVCVFRREVQPGQEVGRDEILAGRDAASKIRTELTRREKFGDTRDTDCDIIGR